MQRQPEVWIGLDVAKSTFYAAINEGPDRMFERSAAGVRDLLDWSRAFASDKTLGLVLEATGSYSQQLAKWLLDADAQLWPAIVNPLVARRFAQSLAVRNKTDECDAHALARYGAERRPARWTPQPPHLEQLRALARERQRLARERVAVQNRAQEPTVPPFITRVHKQHIKNINALVQKIEKQMKALCANHTDLAHDVDLLESIPGVGNTTALTVLAEVGDLRRFRSAKQIGAFVGLSPKRNQSGKSKGKTRLCKQGPSAVRSVLYMCAMCQSRMKETRHAQIYESLVENGHKPISALGAVMRRNIVLMRTLLVRNEKYEEKFCA